MVSTRKARRRKVFPCILALAVLAAGVLATGAAHAFDGAGDTASLTGRSAVSGAQAQAGAALTARDICAVPPAAAGLAATKSAYAAAAKKTCCCIDISGNRCCGPADACGTVVIPGCYCKTPLP